jgi:fido (protein-threonine AMPylation protein)
MPKNTAAIVAHQRDALVSILTGHPDGLSRIELAEAYERAEGRTIQWRTLLRRLEELAAEQRIVPEGHGTKRIYKAAPALAHVTPRAGLEAGKKPRGREVAPADEDYIPVSAAGAEVRMLVRRPITLRGPVGYVRDLLEDYLPGSTWYLPEASREQLHQMGSTPDPDRPAGTFARDIFSRLLIDLAWASSRLEGNTYSRLDTQNLIEFGQRAEGKDLEEAQMILNHKKAIELLVGDAARIAFDRRTLLTLHSALSENLLSDSGEEGSLRKRPVQITGTRYMPIAIPQVIEDCFDLLLAKAAAIPDQFEQSFFVMVHIPYLQPFADVNKRTSRLAANIPLIQANLCPLSFVDVPERAYIEGTLGVYELNRFELLRDVFTWAYARSCAQYKVVREAMGQPDLLRLRYRDQLAEVVRETVMEGSAPRTESLRAWAREHGIASSDVDGFADRALGLLLNLHEGNAGRYHLRPSEFLAWRQRFAPQASG